MAASAVAAACTPPSSAPVRSSPFPITGSPGCDAAAFAVLGLAAGLVRGRHQGLFVVENLYRRLTDLGLLASGHRRSRVAERGPHRAARVGRLRRDHRVLTSRLALARSLCWH